MNNPVVVMGEVTQVSWRNPHIEVYLRESDTGAEWHTESASAIAMTAVDVPPDTVQVGMQIRVAGGPSTRRPNRMEATNYLLPGDIELITNATAAPLWSNRVIGTAKGSGAFETTGSLPEDGRGIFRVWTWEPIESKLWMMEEADAYSLTEAGRAAAESWDEDDPEDNLTLQCIDPGMPSIMGNPHPMEFVERDGAIELRHEEFDAVRTIYMDPVEDPAAVAPSPHGYSVGRWEGDTLVVTTTRLNAPYFNRMGVPQSEFAEIEERFTIDATAGKLRYLLTVTDPVNLAEPFMQALNWNWNENSYLQLYDCASSLSGNEDANGSSTNWLSWRSLLAAFGAIVLLGFLTRRFISRG
jgi:hypothetical protein